MSRDGGATWTRQIGNGLPASPVGKVAVAIARSIPSASSRQSKPATNSLGRSAHRNRPALAPEDGGRRWTLINRDRNVMGRAHYYSRFAVSPSDEDEALLPHGVLFQVDRRRVTLEVQGGDRGPGGDHHVWIDHTTPTA